MLQKNPETVFYFQVFMHYNTHRTQSELYFFEFFHTAKMEMVKIV